MKDSPKIAGIGIPFAAGIAAGAVFFPDKNVIPTIIPFCLAALIPAMTVATLPRIGNNRLLKIATCAIFLATGLFCYISYSLGEGISLPQGLLGRMAERCVTTLKETIDSLPYEDKVTGGLLKALLTGDRSGLDRETTRIFRDSGASHILALSGLHLGILYMILAKLSSPIGNTPSAKRFRFVLTIMAAGSYTVMTGASPSIVRAFLYITIGETARLSGRERSPAGILISALTIQLAINPGVISSLGFQLSYLAMAGIAFLYPRLENLYPKADGLAGKLDPMRKIWSGASVSIACQAFTAPLVWYRFHTFPKYFLITNLTALPLTSAVMVLSVATIALSFFGTCPGFMVSINEESVRLLIRCLEIISSL